MPNLHGIVIEIIGDAKSYIRSAESVISTNTKMDASFRQVGVNANLSAEAQVKAALKSQEALKANAIALQRYAAASPAGSRQQAAATLLAADAEAKYARAIGVRTAETTKLARANSLFRGTVGGIGGFLGVTIGAEAAFSAIHSAENLAAAQRSLDAAIAHTGGSAAQLRGEYLATAKAAAQFGVDEVTATQSLARATLLTGDAESAQRAYTEALVISKALGKDFNQVLIATAKGQEGSTTSLKRYGIILEKGANGQKQFNFIMKRYGDQAKANTTETDKFKASLHNLGTTLGTIVLPGLDKLLGGLTKLADKVSAANAPGKHPWWDVFFQSPLKVGADLYNAAGGIQFFTGTPQHNFGGKLPASNLSVKQQIAQYEMAAAISLQAGFKDIASADLAEAKKLKAAMDKIAHQPRQWNLVVNAMQQIAQAQASLTRSTQDDVAVAKRIVERIRRGIAGGHFSGKKLIEALQEEASALGIIWSAEDAAAQKRAAAAQAAKDRIQAQIENSIDPKILELALAKDTALGRSTRKDLLALKKAAEKALRSGKLSIDQQIEAWNQIASLNDQLKNQSQAAARQIHQANTRLLTAGLHLSAAERAELRARLSHLGIKGGQVGDTGAVGAYGYEIGRNGRPIHVHTTVKLDGRKVAESTTRHQQRTRSRNSSQRRGPNVG